MFQYYFTITYKQKIIIFTFLKITNQQEEAQQSCQQTENLTNDQPIESNIIKNEDKIEVQEQSNTNDIPISEAQKQLPQTSFTLITTMLGSSLLAFPYITSRLGYVLTIIILLHSVISMLWCMYYYINACYYTKAISYKDMVKEILNKKLAVLIDVSITIQCFGFMIAYVIISSNSVLQVIESYSQTIDAQSTLVRSLVKAIISVVLIFPLTCLKSLKQLNKISTLANAIILIYCISMIVYFGKTLKNDKCLCEYTDEETNQTKQIRFGLNTWPQMGALNGFLIFISYVPSIYSNFSAHPVACRFLHELQGPYSYRKTLINKAITVSCIAVAICLSISGFFGGSIFGNDIQQNVLVAFLPCKFLYINILSILYACVVIISFPLQLYPVKASILSYFNLEISEPKGYKWSLLINVIFVLASLLIACLLEMIVTILSIASAIAGILYFFVVPIYCFVIYKQLKQLREEFVTDKHDDQVQVENLATAALSMLLPVVDKESINRVRAASQFFVQNTLVRKDSLEDKQNIGKTITVDVKQPDGTVQKVEYIKRSQSIIQVLKRQQSLQDYKRSLSQYQQPPDQESPLEIAKQAVQEVDNEIQEENKQEKQEEQKVVKEQEKKSVHGLFKTATKGRKVGGIILMVIYTAICLEGVVMNIMDII